VGRRPRCATLGWSLNGAGVQIASPTTGGEQVTTLATEKRDSYVGTDRLLFGMILGVLSFWLFAQTTLNIAPTMAADLGIETSVMNIAVSIAALFSGIFVVVMGGLAD